MTADRIAALFRDADEARRRQGEDLDRLGFGARRTPSRIVDSSRAARLLAYQDAANRAVPILLVPAPIKTAAIWDIAPGSSVVARLRAAGLAVYLVDWKRPGRRDESLGLDEYADAALSLALDAIANETGRARIALAGHSLGGTLASISASLHPRRVASLIALEAPIAFGAGALEATVARSPRASAIAAAFGNVPGSFLAWASTVADPQTFAAEPWLDLVASAGNPDAYRLHWQVRRWTLDESAMARRLFEQVGEHLYRDDAFVRRRLRVGGSLADPRAIDAPILAVRDPRSRIVPPASVDAYRTRTGAAEVEILDYAGDVGVMLQHVGVLVGANAHRLVWPRIVEWINRTARRQRWNRR